MKKIELITKIGFTKNVTAQVVAELNTKTTNAAKDVVERINTYEYFEIFASETHVTSESRFAITQQNIKQIEKATGLTYIKIGEAMEQNNLWIEWTQAEHDLEMIEEIAVEEVAEIVETSEVQPVAENTFKNATKMRVPEKYQLMLDELYIDFDGYWAYAKDGYKFAGMGGKCHTARENTRKEMLQMIRTLKPCNCSNCKRIR